MTSDSAEDDYGWTNATAPHSCDYLVPTIRRIVRQSGAARVIDLGSGNGSLCASLRADLGVWAVGVERDSTGITVARSTYPDIPFYQLSLEDDSELLLASEDERFDVAISTEVVEHLYLPSDLPQFAARVLRPNGLLVITTPYHGYLKNIALSVTNRWDAHLGPLWDGGHIKFWSKRTLTQLLQANGFSPVSFEGVGRIPFLWKSMVVVARRIA